MKRRRQMQSFGGQYYDIYYSHAGLLLKFDICHIILLVPLDHFLIGNYWDREQIGPTSYVVYKN